MKIVEVEINYQTRFSDIKQGDIFQSSLRTYMKIPKVLDQFVDSFYNAVWLENGSLTSFSDSTPILVLKSELKVWR